MDPAPWSDGDMGELERRLLEAAKRDHVPDALGARMAHGLGVHAAGTAAAAEIAAGSQLGAPLFAKAGLWGVLSLALVAAVAGWRAVQSAPPPARAVQQARAGTPPARSSAAVVPFEASAAIAAEDSARPTLPVEHGAAPARPAAGFDDAALRGEIALLDRARAALHRGASARALRMLDRHQERFAPAKLAPEAAALRIEALVQRGSHAQASSMSRQFINAYPTHPLSEHVATLTAPAR